MLHCCVNDRAIYQRLNLSHILLNNDPHEQALARPRRLVAKLRIDGENLPLLRTGALTVAGFRGSRARASRRLTGFP